MATINQITVNSTTYDLAVSAANVSGTVANATTATKLGTATKGSATQPIYLSSGAPTACTYSLAKSVPADAKFTDTTYSAFVKSGSSAAAGLVPKPSTTAGTTKYLREDGTWQVPPDTNTTYSNMGAATSSAAGTAGLVPAPAAGAQAKFLRGDGTWQTPSTSYTLPTASSSTLGGVKVGTGLGISSGTLSVSYGTTATTACKGNDSRLSDSRTPKAHAATATTYGAGTDSNYGHVKLSDSYTTSGGTAAYGVAASSYALVTAYNTLNSKLFLNWYKLVECYRGADPVWVTTNTINSRPISKFNWLIAYVVVNGSPYVRGFAILPRERFTYYGALECNFMNGSSPNYADIKYVDDTTVECKSSSTYGTTIYLYGISIGGVDLGEV